MILTKEAILQEVNFPRGLDEFQVNPHSVDLRLGEEVVLQPGDTKMAQTLDVVGLPGDVMGVVYPRSSTNRRGVSVHMTGVVDANYEGQLVLPMTNLSHEAVTFMRGERVASIVFHRLERQATLRLSKYHKGDGSYMPDKSEESQLLKSGSLDELKARYAL